MSKMMKITPLNWSDEVKAMIGACQELLEDAQFQANNNQLAVAYAAAHNALFLSKPRYR